MFIIILLLSLVHIKIIVFSGAKINVTLIIIKTAGSNRLAFGSCYITCHCSISCSSYTGSRCSTIKGRSNERERWRAFSNTNSEWNFF